MPDLGNLLLPLPTAHPRHRGDPSSSSSTSSSPRHEILDAGDAGLDRKCSRPFKQERKTGKKAADGKASLADHVSAWREKKMAAGVPDGECFFPFLTNAPRMVDCHMCNRCIYPGEELRCSVLGCQEAYHLTCAKKLIGPSTSKPFKCPQHGCFVCKQKAYWRCVRCTMAAHTKCAPWPANVIYFKNRPGRAICWRHSSDWCLEKKD